MSEMILVAISYECIHLKTTSAKNLATSNKKNIPLKQGFPNPSRFEMELQGVHESMQSQLNHKKCKINNFLIHTYQNETYKRQYFIYLHVITQRNQVNML